MNKYEVIVSNIGTVWTGNNPVDANREYGECVLASKQGAGRIGGESVTLMENGEPIKEYAGNQANED